MTVFASHAPGEVIDAIRPDLEAFTSLWTALRVNYEGTNITRTVARLLHMYQPEEGVLAYERLLRTLFVLLEDFDSEGLQLLVSMVPPPKGVADDVIKEVFHRATGFYRVDAPIFHKNTYSNCAATSTIMSVDPSFSRQTPPSSFTNSQAAHTQVRQCTLQRRKATPDVINVPEISQLSNTARRVSVSVLNESAVDTSSAKSPQMVSRESDVFRGFPPSEIFNTQTHVQSINNLYEPRASYGFPSGRRSFVNFGQIIGGNSGQIRQSLVVPPYRTKWFQNPYMIKNNSYAMTPRRGLFLKTIDNQYVKVPGTKVNTFHQSTPQASYQEYLRNRSNTVTSGLLEKIERHRDIREAPSTKPVGETQLPKNINIPDMLRANGERITKTSQVKVTESKDCSDKIMTLENDQNFVNIKHVSSNRNGSDVIEAKIGGNEIYTEDNSVNRENFENFAKEVRMRQRAIQEDIYKMDVVQAATDETNHCDDNEIDPIAAEMLAPSEDLRNSFRRFIQRVKNGESVNCPLFPRTRSLSEIHAASVSTTLESNIELWKMLMTKNISHGGESNVAESTENLANVSLSEATTNQNTIVSPRNVIAAEIETAGSVIKKVVRRKKLEVQPTRVKNQRVVQKCITNDAIHSSDNHLGQDIEKQQLDLRELSTNHFQSAASRCSANDVSNSKQIPSVDSATTMAELAAYKKQYYDALLSIQKAKAAVANSLAISSVGNSARFDPYYYNFLQQQHRQLLQRHQHQMLMDQHRLSHQSNSPWCSASEFRFPVLPGSRIPQRPRMMHHPSSVWPPRVGFRGRDSSVIGSHTQQPRIAQQTKTPMKRRKLEEIVGKLKGNENNSMNN